MSQYAQPTKLEDEYVDGDLKLKDVSGGGFAMVTITEYPRTSVLFNEDAIIQVRNYLNRMIKHYNLEPNEPNESDTGTKSL